tara:strand:+ start:142 stop:1308 length:1167 start_codon:yes stop_codon:yes gene_type:complete
LNIHEHQAKELLKNFGVPVPEGFPAFSVEEAVNCAKKLPGPVYVVKAQIHAGGRGKAGGVKVVNGIDQVKTSAEEILGKILVTPQTGEKGKKVQRLYIENGCNIKKEFYFSILVDRSQGCVSIIASTEGGMNIEEVAEKTPDKIIKLSVDPLLGFMPFHSRVLSDGLGLEGQVFKDSFNFFSKLYKAFVDLDSSLLEINPLVLTKEEKLIALDAKMSFDNNSLFRHPEISDLNDETEEDPAEALAKKHDLAYIKLDGEIGCLVNGAGLAMATMDIIKLKGSSPANFLDVGGSATKEKVTEAFKIILSDESVKGILVNIFGGIMRCDIIAEGVVAAASDLKIDKPLVVRLSGTNVNEGKSILANSDLEIISADNLDEAAEKIVASVNGN